MGLRLRFHDPLDRVTGSCYELYDPVAGHHFLVDCGMRQGDRLASERNQGPLPFDPSTLDFVVLTHAHLDHCGLIPRLYREGFGGTVFATKETIALAKTVLRDAARYEGASYTRKHVDRIKWHEPGNAVFGQFCPVGTNLWLRFYRTGHILGATAVTVISGPRPRPGEVSAQRSITFSGDLGDNAESNEHAPLMRFRMGPALTDYAVVESTYGGTVRAPEQRDQARRLERLHEALTTALGERRGPVIMPAFAVGRTQDLLFDLHLLFAQHPDTYSGVPVILDGPMAMNVSRVYAAALGRTVTHRSGKVRLAWLAKALFDTLGLRRDVAEDEAIVLDALREMLRADHVPTEPRPGVLANWRRIWTCPEERSVPDGPSIVVTGGGMCDGGPVQFYLRALLDDPKATLLLTGYASPASLAGRLQCLASLGREDRARQEGSLDVMGDAVPLSDVQLHIGILSGYSAHADQAGLLDWLFGTLPDAMAPTPIAKTVFVTHGDPSPRRALAQAIERRAVELGGQVRTELPSVDHGWFDLDSGDWLADERDEVALLRAQVEALQRRLAALESANAE